MPTDDKLLARFTAIQAVTLALIDTHQNKPELAQHMGAVGEFLLAQWLNSPGLSDEFVAEYQKQMAMLQKRCQLD